MLIAQITDLHVRPRGLAANRVVETNMMTERAIDAVVALRPRPDVVLITGDLTDYGLVEEYEELKRMLQRLDIPFFVIPGNHDRREN
jgi:3',5'-cyclic AMP phosphodiesterase CpdA